jgi:CRP-like cAMP-binding protein
MSESVGLNALLQRFGQRYAPHQLIFAEGDPGKEVFFIVEGRVEVTLSNGRVLCQLGPGDVFGEMALFNEAPRTASISTLEAVQTLVFNRENLYSQISLYPELAVRLLKLVAQRMQRMDRDLKAALSERAYQESLSAAPESDLVKWVDLVDLG